MGVVSDTKRKNWGERNVSDVFCIDWEGEESSRQWTLTNGPRGGDGEIARTSHLPPRG